MNFKTFYQQIGNLLYAISAIDGSVNPREIEKIKEVVKDQLLPIENSEDEFGMDAAFLAEFQFDFCSEIWSTLKKHTRILFRFLEKTATPSERTTATCYSGW